MDAKKMKGIDPEKVDRTTLTDYSSVKIPSRLTGEARTKEFVRQMKNPYCYRDGKMVVKLSFSETRKSLKDCVYDYLNWR